MAWQALYRTYRPETFADIVGQESITTTLKNQILSGRIAHAYLFCGSRGTGKTTTARVFARAINCLNPKDGFEPCGECEVCRSFLEERGMDLIEIDAASNNSIDEIRDLRDKVKYPPVAAQRKVYIIDEVHMLSTGAFNALLKTLEEPPEHAVFLLATTEPNRLPPTILSRCQRFDFRRYSVDVIKNHLKTILGNVGADADEEAISDIARAAEGCMRDALSLLDLCLSYGDNHVSADIVREAIGTSGASFLFDFADCLLEDNAAGALKAIDALMRDGRDARAFGREMTGHLRDLLVVQALGNTADQDATAILDCTKEEADRYIKQASKADTDKLLRMLDLFMRTDSDLRWETQARTILEMCAFLCCRPQEQLRLDALAERVAKLEKQIAEGVVTRAPAAQPKAKPAGSTPAAAPAPAQDQSASQAPAPDSAKWEEVKNALLEESKALSAPLNACIYAGREGNAVILEFSKNHKMFMQVLSTESKKAKLVEKTKAVFGSDTTVILRMKEEKKAASADPERTDTIKLARDVFGRENVDFLD